MYRYFTGNTRGSDGNVQFIKGSTSISNVVDDVVKIVTIAVSTIISVVDFYLLAAWFGLTKYIFQVTIVVVAVPEGLPLAVTLT